jgi:hypothetical protein
VILAIHLWAVSLSFFSLLSSAPNINYKLLYPFKIIAYSYNTIISNNIL